MARHKAAFLDSAGRAGATQEGPFLLGAKQEVGRPAGASWEPVGSQLEASWEEVRL